MNKNILLIGGGGYIGAHLVPQLLATGRNVTVLGRSTLPHYNLPYEAKYLSGDFSKADLLKELLDKHEEVIHLAYATVPNTSFDNPLADLQQNLPPTLELFSEAANRQVKLILVSSGGTVYGNTNDALITEEHQTKPISPYGVTKLTLESYANLYAVTRGLKYICVRPANAYGIGQRPFTGQGFISTAIAFALGNQPIKIYGKEGTIRDYLYVSDIASGIVSILEKGLFSETYNIGSGIGVSNLDIVKSIQHLINQIGLEVRIENLPERTFDVKSNVLDSLKLKETTGWKPLVNFTDGLYQTFEWLRFQKSIFS